MPDIYIIAGPNGAGKTTAFKYLSHRLPEEFEYINADEIAESISGADSESVALEAGRLMLESIRELVDHGKSFAFETTMAGRAYASHLKNWKEKGYRINIIFLWLHTTRLALERVAARVQGGGHKIPEATIKRRYQRGIDNFFNLYTPIANYWAIYDGSFDEPALVARQKAGKSIKIHNPDTWAEIRKKSR